MFPGTWTTGICAIPGQDTHKGVDTKLFPATYLMQAFAVAVYAISLVSAEIMPSFVHILDPAIICWCNRGTDCLNVQGFFSTRGFFDTQLLWNRHDLIEVDGIIIAVYVVTYMCILFLLSTSGAVFELWYYCIISRTSLFFSQKAWNS